MEAARRLLAFALLWAAPACSFRVVPATGDDSGVDGEVPPDASLCADKTASCASSTVLRECTTIGQLPVDTTCAWGCLAQATPHCGRITPSSDVLTAADLDPDPMLADRRIGPATGVGVINTGDGSITGARGKVEGYDNGIEFRIRTIGGRSVAVFRFSKLTLVGDWVVQGPRALAIASVGDVIIQGRLDLTPACATGAGPGGFPGGAVATSATGSGAGQGANSNTTSGGGGGGYGAAGGDGGRSGGGGPVTGGTAWGTAEISQLVGGGGGGGGANGTGAGGGGGGAIQIAANGRVTIRSDAAVTPSGINAGGCGGKRGGNGGTTGGAGGGGGAGGAILIEALDVELDGAALAVNGGSGGGGNNGAGPGNGSDGPLGAGPATGGKLSGNGGDGGNGGATNSRTGSPGGDGTGDASGGGGGGVGRIRVNTRAADGVTVTAPAIVSPTFEETGTTSTKGIAPPR